MNQKTFDVIVAGGGTAGAIAGLAAARNGARTLIVEKNRCLGGQFTAGMMGAWVGFSDKLHRCVGGIAWELRNILNELGAVVDEDPETDVCYLYDTEVAKVVLADLAAREPNLTTYLNTQIVDVLQVGDTLSGLVILSEMELMEVRAEMIVDCTGDAAVAAKAGVPCEIRPKKEIQPMSLVGKMSGVDLARVKAYYKEHPPVKDHMVAPSWREFKTFPGFMHYGFMDMLEGVELPPHLEYLRSWFGTFMSSPNEGEITINCSGAYLSAISGFLGVRESRRVLGDYKVTMDDFMAARDFEDSIGRGAMPAGYHTADGVTMIVYNLEPGKSMTIPYRCMVAKGKENLLVAGRCASYEIEVANCIRCMPQCMAMGEAAGTAAALAVKHSVTARRIDVGELQKILKDNGGIL